MANLSNEELPNDWTPTQAVDDPIINTPYDEPQKHWLYREGIPEIMDWRRPASYYYKVKRLGRQEEELFDEYKREENRDDLPLVNALREDVGRWRKSGYRGASNVTKELLNYWMRDDRPRRLFFCQLESVETIIYLLEFAIPDRLNATGFKNFKVDAANYKKLLTGEMPDFESLEDASFFPRLIDTPADNNLLPIRRLGCKMATGSGKTIVMAMLIAWAFCNRGRNPASRQYPNAALICAPNLTVRKRLQVLKPEDPDNYYDHFDIVPARYREYLNLGRVLITNWHKFAPKSEHSEDGKSYPVVNKGEEPSDAFTMDRLGDLASCLPILVFNDEGHHCWRPKPDLTEKEEKAALSDLSKEEKEILKKDSEDARVWLAGLDKVNNCGLLGNDDSGEPNPGVLACVDLSATPFYLSNSGYPEGSPFPWLVSDFGLIDAIESGITKVPRLPVMDDKQNKDDAGCPDPKYFRLWEKIKESCTKNEKIRNTPKTEAVFKHAQDALVTLASQWKLQFDKYRDDAAGKPFIPPVMIVVCDNTDIAQLFFENIAGEKEEEIPDPENAKKTITVKKYGSGGIFPDLLGNTETEQRTIHIDSKLLAKLESDEYETKDQAILRMREVIDTVGKSGRIGEQVRCVVSVSMLTEGWDANNVTHILGVRAFGSQLLCEQVVGRGLRRMSYVPDPHTGLLPAEYADVYGIPFSLIPFKGKPKDKEDKPDPIHHRIYAMEERSAFEIRIPNVESYVYELRSQGIECNIDELEPLVVDETPGTTWVRAPRGYQDDPTPAQDLGDFVEHTREEWYKTVRPQTVTFWIAQMILEDLMSGAQAEDDRARAELRLKARHQLFPELVSIVQQYIDRKVTFKSGLDSRELGLEIYVRKLVQRIRDGVLPAASEKGKLIPVLNRFRPSNTTADVNYPTVRPVVDLAKSHLNRAMIQSDYERTAIEILEEMDCVEFYTPNDRGVGLIVPYEYGEEMKSYEPDFIVRLGGGVTLMLEIKGEKGRIHDPNQVYAKNAAAKKWCVAVSNLKHYGQWEYEICGDADDEKYHADLRSILLKHATGGDDLPFDVVDASSGTPWKTCVPLVSLHTAAAKLDRQQMLADGAWNVDLIRWRDHPSFQDGMFVAKVHGSGMLPTIPTGSYCLFGAPHDEDMTGKIVLAKHAGINDPHTSGSWTVRRFERTSAEKNSEDWTHDRIVLQPDNNEYPAITFELKPDQEFEILGELVGVICSRVES